MEDVGGFTHKKASNSVDEAESIAESATTTWALTIQQQQRYSWYFILLSPKSSKCTWENLTTIRGCFIFGIIA